MEWRHGGCGLSAHLEWYWAFSRSSAGSSSSQSRTVSRSFPLREGRGGGGGDVSERTEDEGAELFRDSLSWLVEFIVKFLQFQPKVQQKFFNCN